MTKTYCNHYQETANHKDKKIKTKLNKFEKKKFNLYNIPCMQTTYNGHVLHIIYLNNSNCVPSDKA